MPNQARTLTKIGANCGETGRPSANLRNPCSEFARQADHSQRGLL
jgi:hypothetical protein